MGTLIDFFATAYIALAMSTFSIYTYLIWKEVVPRLDHTKYPTLHKVILTLFGIIYAGILWPWGGSAILADVDGRNLQKRVEGFYKLLKW